MFEENPSKVLGGTCKSRKSEVVFAYVAPLQRAAQLHSSPTGKRLTNANAHLNICWYGTSNKCTCDPLLSWTEALKKVTEYRWQRELTLAPGSFLPSTSPSSTLFLVFISTHVSPPCCYLLTTCNPPLPPFTFHIPLVFNTVCASSVWGQLILGRAGTGRRKLTVWRTPTNK